MTTSERRKALIDLFYEYENCVNCPLGHTRKNFVFGTGNPDASIVFVGEAPGKTEDEQGKPFIGRAGTVLSNLLSTIDLEREDVFILNVLKCRPPANRNPGTIEIEACRPILNDQLKFIDPKVIICLGKVAANTLLNVTDPMKDMISQVYEYLGIPVHIAYHPAATLYNSNLTEKLEDIFKSIKKLIDNGE
jgi:DNA polymerase|tara:strand:+ start:2545 stop:3117 length:573 start_codon:yes stop_codon:yes gene_type:complete